MHKRQIVDFSNELIEQSKDQFDTKRKIRKLNYE